MIKISTIFINLAKLYKLSILFWITMILIMLRTSSKPEIVNVLELLYNI